MIDRVEVSAYTIPTDAPESDGTIAWKSTTIVIVEATAGDTTGVGYAYADLAAADIVRRILAPRALRRDPMATTEIAILMAEETRNIGRPGLVSSAISAVDSALWDLKARLLGVSLVDLLGPAREAIPAYGSGGFTSYSADRLQRQLADWVESGIRAVKMKIGREPERDLGRVRAARAVIGGAELFVDANGAYRQKQAIGFANAVRELDVSWFEEPVSSDDLDGLRLVRDRVPGGMRVAAGEYGYDTFYFRRMLDAGAVDVLQADATRCGGITGFLRASALCEAHNVPLSAHTAPTLHTHLCCAVGPAINVEYFHDHARIERMMFDGACEPVNGLLRPDRSRPGMGLELKRRDAERFAA